MWTWIYPYSLQSTGHIKFTFSSVVFGVRNNRKKLQEITKTYREYEIYICNVVVEFDNRLGSDFLEHSNSISAN